MTSKQAQRVVARIQEAVLRHWHGQRRGASPHLVAQVILSLEDIWQISVSTEGAKAPDNFVRTLDAMVILAAREQPRTAVPLWRLAAGLAARFFGNPACLVGQGVGEKAPTA